MIALIGPNGAGKTTTLKMLTGLLHPTSGELLINGFTPGKRSHDFLSNISIVLGNKSQMLWDIPAIDTFQVLGEIYCVPKATLQQRIDEMVSLLDLPAILRKPVRNLSLGERMKCELVASLLHQPKVLFLDEPTLGLDISIQNRLRNFILEYNRKYQATILLMVLLKPEFTFSTSEFLLFWIAILFARALRFLWGLWIALLTFWATRADAFLALQDSMVFIFSGMIAPVAILPEFLQTIANFLPFRYMVGFPVEILTANLSTQQI